MQRFPVLSVMLVLTLAAALAACGRGEEVTGQLEMPATLGEVKRHVLGCADLSGLYAWPPVSPGDAGPQPAERKAPAPARRVSLAPIEVPVYAEAQVWVEGPNGTKGMHVRTRMINRDPRVRNRLALEWSQAHVTRTAITCRGSWVEIAGMIHDDEATQRSAGGKSVQQGARLARLRDGSLVLGQWRRVSGREEHLTVGGRTLLSWPIGDRVHWQWHRLERIGDSGKDATPGEVAMDERPARRRR